MKIGILTFHSQLNYGGVLQCWALQTALEKMGHEVVVIDRWLDGDNSWLEKKFIKFNILDWCKFCLRSALGLGDIHFWLRVKRTKKFLKKCIRRTPYHFVEWNEAPEDLGIDMLIVGSDQVWHSGNWGNPRVYLLDKAPMAIKSVAYAASFGFAAIPRYLNERDRSTLAEPFYKTSLAKFKAISCREAEGVKICEKLGYRAVHVVDPTLLLNLEDWGKIVQLPLKRKDVCPPKKIACYLLGKDYKQVLPIFYEFARQTNCEIDILVDQWVSHVLPLPLNKAKFKTWLSGIGRKIFSRVHISDSAGPEEFLQSLATADAVISDSFHALMFSIVFGKNVRIVRPDSEKRRMMFKRIEEFASHAEGPLIVEDELDALESISKGEIVKFDHEWLAARREYSLDFLRENLR